MLRIHQEILTETDLPYIALRVACQDTFYQLFAAQQFGEFDDGFGFLASVPFLQGVAPRIQIDVLATTWALHRASRCIEASLVDEVVIFSACEHAASLCEHEPEAFMGLLQGGPLMVEVDPGEQLARELRSLFPNSPTAVDFLLISQLESLPPQEAAGLKAEYGLDDARIEPLFDLLGRWQVDPRLSANLEGLMIGEEIEDLRELVETPTFRR